MIIRITYQTSVTVVISSVFSVLYLRTVFTSISYSPACEEVEKEIHQIRVKNWQKPGKRFYISSIFIALKAGF